MECSRDPASRLSPTTVLYVDEDEIRPLPLLLAYNKPVGVHSTMGDPVGRMSLEDVIPARFASQFHPVGRLDADTSGLLLFSADGQLTHRLLHPKTGVDREYQATVEGACDLAHSAYATCFELSMVQCNIANQVKLMRGNSVPHSSKAWKQLVSSK